MKPGSKLIRFRSQARILFLASITVIAAALLQSCSGVSTHPANVDPNAKFILVNLDNPSSLNPWRTSTTYTQGNNSWSAHPEVARTLSAVQSDYSLVEVDGWPIDSLGLYCTLFSVNSSVNVDELVSELNQDKRIAFAEAQEIFEPMTLSSASYSDPLLDMQYPEHEEALYSLHQISTGDDVRIGIIDSGIDKSHPDLKGRIQNDESFLLRGEASNFSHGTAVAGVIGALTDNQEGIVGLAPAARIHAYEACGERHGSVVCTSFNLAKAMEYAIEDKLSILNLSLAGKETPLLRMLVDKLLDQGIILVAANNDASEIQNFPANFRRVHAVSGVESTNNLWFARAQHLSTQAGGGYRYYEGSSMSAAGITGFTAVLLGAHSTEKVDQIVGILLDSACNVFPKTEHLSTNEVLDFIESSSCVPANQVLQQSDREPNIL